MPFIHIQALPFESAFDVASAIEAFSVDFAEAAGVGLEHITVTWRWLEPGHYAVGGRSAQRQPRGSHPLLVELVTPDFHPPATVEKMLQVLADSLARRTGLPVDNVFIQHRRAKAGRVFDAGQIVRW
ncbi:hypothetical protein [Chitinolyticbacter meiyuanensis]|uniref:hypothetical protein n=1 Tax=Chitinolyticbacter meiyuanensis TaxID=682798 RepID=UPI0011E5D8EC|nr:hypothetical protein [Chitinolyticbacter meiyuanensis]